MPAAVLGAVVPGGPLGGRLGALEDPVAELAADREDAAEEAAVHEPPQLAQAGEEELVLHDAVLDAGLARQPREPQRGVEVGRRRLLAVDVLAGGDRSLHALGRALGGGGVEVHLAVGSASASSRFVLQRSRPWRSASARSFASLRPTSIGSGQIV